MLLAGSVDEVASTALARTATVWGPSGRAGVHGLAGHGSNAPLSTLHWKVAPGVVELKVTCGFFVGTDGPAATVCGGWVS